MNYFNLLKRNMFQYLASKSVSPVANPIYGVEWVNDTTTTMTRTDDAVGMTYAINSSTGAISSDFNSVFPWNETEIITDTAGNKFLHFPDMYFRVGTDNNGDINSVAVSKTQGSTGDWYKCDSFDYGIYGASLNGTLLESKTGQTRLATNRANFRTYAGNNSQTGYIYHQLDLKHKIVTMFLWWIEWAKKDSSSIMKGHISGSPTASGSKVNTGGTDNLTTPSGFNTATWQMRYHYIEDFVGNLQEFTDGIIGGSTTVADYVTDNPAYFSDSDTSNMSQLSWADAQTGCIKAWGMDSNKPFMVMPTKVTGGSDYSQAFCDRIYNESSANAIVYFGSRYSQSTTYEGLCAVFHYTGNCGSHLLRQPTSNFS